MRISTILSTLYLGFIDEQFYPEILNYDWNSMNFFKEVLVYQSDLIVKTQNISKFNYVSKLIKEMEILRVLRILKSYHRIRIWKIENFLLKEINFKKLISSLSRSEEYYSISFQNLVGNYQNIVFYDFISKDRANSDFNFSKSKRKELSSKKNLFLFFRLFDKNIPVYQTNLNHAFYLKLITKLTFCMKYYSIKYLVFSKILCLV